MLTPEFIAAAHPARRATGDRWFVDETYVRVAGRWTYLYRAVDQHGQVIDVPVSTRRDAAAARRVFARAQRCGPAPVEVITDRACLFACGRGAGASCAACHRPIRQQFHRGRPRPVESQAAADARGLKRLACARTVATGHAFVQNLRRAHYAITADMPVQHWVRIAFNDLALSL
jgi:transposase, IS6 family